MIDAVPCDVATARRLLPGFGCWRRGRFRLFAAASLALVAALCGCDAATLQTKASAGGTARARRQENTMTTLQMILSTPGAEWLAAAPFPVSLTLKNTGAAPGRVPSRDSPRPFEFVLHSADGQSVVRILSARAAARAGRPDAPKPPLALEELAPGASAEYPIDLATFANPPVEIGRYLLSVRLDLSGQRLETSPGPLNVVPPRISRLAVVVGPSQDRLAMAYTHLAMGPVTKVFQYESRPGQPQLGLACERIQFKGMDAVAGVAVATEFNRNQGIRWYAWLHDGAGGGGVAQYTSSFRQIAAGALGLADVALHPAGWQTDNESAVFAALGRDEAGAVSLALVTLSVQSETPSIEKIRLANVRPPVVWSVRCRGAEPPGVFDVFTVDGGTDRIRVTQQAVSKGSGAASTPRVLAERDGPLAAFGCAAVGAQGSGAIDLLTGPHGERSEMAFARLPLDGTSAPVEWTFSACESPESRRVPSMWAIAPHPLPDPPVLALLGDRLVVRRSASAAGWTTLADNARGVRQLRLEVVAGRVWAIWADPDRGLQYRPVP